MKKLFIGCLSLASIATFANTDTATITKTTQGSIQTAKKISISLRRDLNLQVSGRMKFKGSYEGESYSSSSKFGFNEVEGVTLASAYTDRINDGLMYDIGASFSKINGTSSETKESDYVEHLRIESNLSTNFTERFSAFGGLNISKFTRGQFLVDMDPGLGIQFGLQAKITKNLKADLRYWETNNKGSEKESGETMEVDYQFSSTTLGISYIF